MVLQKAMVSSKSSEWATPDNLFNLLDEEFNFTLDPCATNDNAKCKKFYTKEDDGLTKSWKNEIVFMNPPYCYQTKVWLDKAMWEAKNNNAVVVCLIVSATDRSYWHTIIYPFASEIRFLRGRINFGNGKSKYNPPFGSAIVIFEKGNSYCHIKFVDYREYQKD